MTSSEAERCFSTLKQIKTCLRSTMGEKRLNALAMISIDNKIISNDIDLNQKVTDMFNEIKDRH